MEDKRELGILEDRYAAALLSGDQAEAFRVIKDTMERGINPLVIYTEVITPALVKVGQAWHGGKLNIAEEHLAIQLTLQHSAYIRGLARRRKPIGAEAVITAVEGEMHAVGARLIADLFYLEGWDVAYLGQNTPTADLVEWVRERKPDLVLLSLSQRDRIPIAKEAARTLKSIDNAPLVFVGGVGLSDPTLRAAIPADLISGDPLEAISVANRLLRVSEEPRTAEDYLSVLGRRVFEMRKDRGWSQQELAAKSGLDRAYLSTVEKGKQNITIGAAARIAAALDTTLSALIEEEDAGRS